MTKLWMSVVCLVCGVLVFTGGHMEFSLFTPTVTDHGVEKDIESVWELVAQDDPVAAATVTSVAFAPAGHMATMTGMPALGYFNYLTREIRVLDLYRQPVWGKDAPYSLAFVLRHELQHARQLLDNRLIAVPEIVTDLEADEVAAEFEKRIHTDGF